MHGRPVGPLALPSPLHASTLPPSSGLTLEKLAWAAKCVALAHENLRGMRRHSRPTPPFCHEREATAAENTREMAFAACGTALAPAECASEAHLKETRCLPD